MNSCLTNPKEKIKTTENEIIITSKKYTVTEYLKVQFITCFDKNIYGHNKNKDILKNVNEFTDSLYISARECNFAHPHDPIFKKNFFKSRFAKQFKEFTIESETFYEKHFYIEFIIFVKSFEKPFIGRDIVTLYDCLKFVLTR